MKTVAVAISGGVDSAVTALLLKEQGYRVFGVTMPTTATVAARARQIADYLGIDHLVADLGPIFQERVIEYFCRAYLDGRTPNPCLACNRHVKYGALFDCALARGADYFATGHYARVKEDREHGRHLLLRGLDPRKDQSYVLYHLPQNRLRRLLLPLGTLSKDAVRQKAARAGLPYGREESQEICFVPDDDYRRFLAERYGDAIRPGNFVDREGRVLGRHGGLPFYTVGQRKGLGIALGTPVYVIGLDARANTVILGSEADLAAGGLIAEQTHFIMNEYARADTPVEVQIRYNARAVPARLFPAAGNTCRVVFDRPQRAVTPGQAAVFYDNAYVVGGGIIVDKL